MGKFHILILALALSKSALTASLDGVVTTKPCGIEEGDGNNLVLNLDSCTGNRCDLEQLQNYTLSGSWEFGGEGEGENATTRLSFDFSAYIKGNESASYTFISKYWTPEGVIAFEPEETYSFKEMITVPALDFQNKDVVVKLSMRDEKENRNEICVEADLKINGAPWLLLSTGLLLSLQMLLRLF